MTTLTQAQEVIPAGVWQLDPVHSRVGFAVDYLAGTFHGTFAPFEATLAVDEKGSATLSGSAKVEAVQVQDENLSVHLLTPDFFDAELAPELTFASNRFEREGAAVSVAGALTIKGVSRPVELTGRISGPVVDPYDRERINLKLDATVDRTAFGIDWNVPLPDGQPALADEVALSAELALVRS